MITFEQFLRNIGWPLVFDIIILLFSLIFIFLSLKKKRSIKLAVLVTVFILLYLTVSIITALSSSRHLYLMKRIFDIVGIYLTVSFAIYFQKEFRNGIEKISRSTDIKQIFKTKTSADELRESALEIVNSCQAMAKNDVGAIILIAPTVLSTHILDSGTKINAAVSSGILESIFATKGPLHDGAVVISGNKILAAGCFLPLSQEISISKDLGTRHRAAIGITEQSDALAIVISEETGIISTVLAGRMRRYMTPERLLEQIEETYGLTYNPNRMEG